MIFNVRKKYLFLPYYTSFEVNILQYKCKNLDLKRIPEELDYPEAFIKALGMIPSSYLRYYYLTRKVVAELSTRPKSRAEEVLEIERQLLDDFANPQLCEMPAGLEKRGGAYYSRAALELVQAIHGDQRSSR